DVDLPFFPEADFALRVDFFDFELIEAGRVPFLFDEDLDVLALVFTKPPDDGVDFCRAAVFAKTKKSKTYAAAFVVRVA
ncbi:MAG: hypothetical protein AB7H97_05490, partial [Pseudobdellovibrionaceae bacterium]